MRWPTLTIAIALPLAACAAPLPPNAAPGAQPEVITLRTPGDLTHATMEGSRMFGPLLEVSRYEDGYRGRNRRGLVNLRSQDDMIKGMVGSDRTELHVERHESDGFRVRGLNGGTLGELDVRSDRIVGQLGGCHYDLRQATVNGGTTYRGQRACGGMPHLAELTLPPTVVALEPLERATVLAIFLGP